MKKNSEIRGALCILVAALMCLSLASCGAKWEKDEIKSALGDLLPKSFELNEIYFGQGLPVSGDAELTREFFDSFESDVKAANYAPVDEECGYTSVEEIKSATLEVFTAEYSEYLFTRAFVGISAVYNEGSDAEESKIVSYAMYMEQNGILTVRLDIADDALPIGREYDVDKLEIVRQGKDFVIAAVPTRSENGEEFTVRLKLVMTDDGWRLDTPTY